MLAIMHRESVFPLKGLFFLKKLAKILHGCISSLTPFPKHFISLISVGNTLVPMGLVLCKPTHIYFKERLTEFNRIYSHVSV